MINIFVLVLCVAILIGQLWRAKKTNMQNVHWLYHLGNACMSLGVACTMFVPVQWPSLVILCGVFAYQCAGVKRWQGDNIPSEYESDKAPLGNL